VIHVPLAHHPQQQHITAMTVASAETVETKLCARCLNPVALSAFRPRNKAGDLADTCRLCHAESMKVLRLRKRIGKARRFAGEIRRAADELATRRLVRAAVTAFGGPKRFVIAWGAAVAAAQPGTLAMTNLLCATARLAELAEPPRSPASQRYERELISDAELEARVVAMEQRMLAAARAQVASAAAPATSPS
jgi:hypothetical protein